MSDKTASCKYADTITQSMKGKLNKISIEEKFDYCLSVLTAKEIEAKIKDGISIDEIYTELQLECRDKDIFFEGKKFIHNLFGDYIRKKYHMRQINNSLHIYDENFGCYTAAEAQRLHYIMIEELQSLSFKQRNEVINYLNAICSADDFKEEGPELINFKNGYLNILTGELKEHSPDMIFTYCIPHNYKISVPKNAVAEDFFDSVTCGDSNLKKVLFEIIGYCFYTSVPESKFFILNGEGCNGKSTYMNLLEFIFSEKNCSALDLKEIGEKFKTILLYGKLVNLCADISNSKISNDECALLKRITGNDSIIGDRKFSVPLKFRCSTKLIFSSNDLPVFSDTSNGLNRRLTVIPFKAKFDAPGKTPVKNLSERLATEDVAEYVINKAVIALKELIKRNFEFTPSDVVTDSTLKAQNENDTINEFYANTYPKPTEAISGRSTTSIYIEYCSFCRYNSLKAVTQKKFVLRTNELFNMKTGRKYMGGTQVHVFEALKSG